MGYFKIKSLTPELGKRHNKVNTTLYVEISSNFKDDRIAINPGAEIFLESLHLPISVHKLRSEGLVSVVELDKNSYIKNRAAADAAKKKLTQPVLPQVVENKVVVEDKVKKYQQKFTKKDKDESAE